jgi:iron-sulfur cluster repair protein YtfE (RIC family)
MLNLDQTVATIARENPDAQLADAIADDTRAELEAPTLEGLGPLFDYILTTHHEFAPTALPRLEALSRKVAVVHGAAHPALTEIARLVVAASIAGLAGLAGLAGQPSSPHPSTRSRRPRPPAAAARC